MYHVTQLFGQSPSVCVCLGDGQNTDPRSMDYPDELP